MEAKEKAKELVEKFKDYVHGYVGSSMLANYEYPERILSQAKECALITVNEILSHDFLEPQLKRHVGSVKPNPTQLEYWFEVKKEIEQYEI